MSLRRFKKFVLLISLASTFSISQGANALEYPLPTPGNDVVGQIQTVIASRGDTLSNVGMRYDIGYFEMVEANPGLPRNGQIKPGEMITIPSRFVLPSVRRGLVVNLAELRVYYYPKNQPYVYTFPVGVGREGWGTPRGTTTVARKKADPTWVVPPSIMRESIRNGKPLKSAYGPGPNNPLGKYAIYLNLPGIRLHGTNVPASVGRRVSHGCIRLLADDIKFLYENVPVGTPVTIMYEASKVGWDGPYLYLEEEVPFKELYDESATTKIEQALQHHSATVDWKRVKEVMEDQDGMPTAIGYNNSVKGLPADNPALIDVQEVVMEDSTPIQLPEPVATNYSDTTENDSTTTEEADESGSQG